MALEEENKAKWPQEHPLLNSVVLKQVFDYLRPCGNLDTLKSVRQVCTVWRDESLGLWRETAILNLTPEMTENPELVTITQLLEKKPFQKYKLKDATIDIPQCLEEGTQANRFWNTVGPHVKQLTLEQVTFRCIKGELEGKPGHAFMYFLIDQLPNLNTLDINHATGIIPWAFVYYVQQQELKRITKLQHPNLLSLKFDLIAYFALSNFPNLQHLAVDDVGSFIEMLKNEHSSESDQIMNSLLLKDLELILPEDTSFKDDNVLDFLGQIKLPALERLSIDYCHGRHNSSFKFLPVFLKNHSEKLKILEVSCFPYVHPYSKFPFDCQLDQLTELRLWGNVVKDLSFLKWTPKLKLLHMDSYGLEKKDVPEPYERGNMHLPRHDIVEAAVNGGGTEGIILDDLEYLQINQDLLSLQSLKTLGEWMPNVKTLRMVLKEGFIAGICDQWPLLEHLVVMHGSKLTDEDVIGNEGEGAKGLWDLVELKTFRLNAACDEGRLTDVATHSGFLKMAKLTDLQVCVSEQFTLDAEKLLKDRLWNVVITRNYSENKEHKDWNCCKNTNHMQFLHDSYDGSSDASRTTTDSEGDDDPSEVDEEDVDYDDLGYGEYNDDEDYYDPY